MLDFGQEPVICCSVFAGVRTLCFLPRSFYLGTLAVSRKFFTNKLIEFWDGMGSRDFKPNLFQNAQIVRTLKWYRWLVLRKSGNFGYLSHLSEHRHITILFFFCAVLWKNFFLTSLLLKQVCLLLHLCDISPTHPQFSML